MKKLTFVASLAIAAATLTSCGNSTPKADMKNDVDSMSYAIGLVQSQYIRQAIEQGQVIDTVYIDEFIKGINEVSTQVTTRRNLLTTQVCRLVSSSPTSSLRV